MITLILLNLYVINKYLNKHFILINNYFVLKLILLRIKWFIIYYLQSLQFLNYFKFLIVL